MVNCCDIVLILGVSFVTVKLQWSQNLYKIPCYKLIKILHLYYFVLQRGSRAGGPTHVSRTLKCTNNTLRLLKVHVHISWKNYEAKGQHMYGLVQIVVSKFANYILGLLFCFLSLPQREVTEVRRPVLMDSYKDQCHSTSTSNPVFKT